jgi:hypothetical protein
MRKAGYGFSLDGMLDMPCMLPYFREAGYHQIEIMPCVLEVSHQTEAWMYFCQIALVGHKQAQPFLIETGVAEQQKLDLLYSRMDEEIRAESFFGLWHLFTVQGANL